MRRRTLLLGATAVLGGTAFGYMTWRETSAARRAHALTSTAGGPLLAGWVKIGHDNTVTLYMPHVDFGQGAPTGLAMMCAEEMDADWSQMRIVAAPADPAFANRFIAKGFLDRLASVPAILQPLADAGYAEAARALSVQTTGGSAAIRFTGQIGMRVIGAGIRAALVSAAAKRWSVPADALTVSAGIVAHVVSGKQASFGELADAAALERLPSRPVLKRRDQFRLIGTSPPRFDIHAKCTGQPIYGIDVRLPDMRYAAVRAAPVPGGMLVSVDPAPALGVAGVIAVVPMAEAVAVVATRYWQARKALAALQPVFSDAGYGAVSSASLAVARTRALAELRPTSQFSLGNTTTALAAPGSTLVEARYSVPFLHHAAMEPINLTAHWTGTTLDAWGGMQDPLATRAKLAKLAGLGLDQVTFHPTAIGGSFGRRLPTKGDVHLAQALAVAKAAGGKPVKLIWSREEDFAQGTYRQAGTALMRGAIDASGAATSWSLVYTNKDEPAEAPAIPYAIAHQAIGAVAAPTHLRTGSWRSVAHSQHGFYTECFIDELAHAAKRDPFEFRRDLLPAGSRARRVLETVASRSGWGTPMASGRGRGIALVLAFDSIVAEVVEASVDSRGRVKVHRVSAVVDCGLAVHPNAAAQQIEGAILMGLSSALGEQITIAQGAVVEQNFPDYPLLDLAAAPVIDVHFLTSDGPFGGLGEPGLPPTAPALANALFAATGKRVRELPLGRAFKVV